MRRASLAHDARRELLLRQRSLRARWRAAEADADELRAEHEADWEDEAARKTGAEQLHLIGEAERQQLALVTGALARLDEGTWGRCVDCGALIDEARLRIVPEAARCGVCTGND